MSRHDLLLWELAAIPIGTVLALIVLAVIAWRSRHR